MDSIDETDTTMTIVPTITPDLTTCTLRPSQAFILRHVNALTLQMLVLIFIKAPGGIGKTVVAARIIHDRFVKGTVSLLFAPASHLVDAVTAILCTTNLTVLPVYGGSGGAESLRDLGITTDVIVSPMLLPIT
jgi:superfamily II DNA or RNA helicase